MEELMGEGMTLALSPDTDVKYHVDCSVPSEEEMMGEGIVVHPAEQNRHHFTYDASTPSVEEMMLEGTIHLGTPAAVAADPDSVTLIK
jgi:hypothetical protein